METSFSVELTNERKAQTIYPFIQLESVAEQIAGKSTELTLDHWSYNHDSKRKKGLWHYQEL